MAASEHTRWHALVILRSFAAVGRRKAKAKPPPAFNVHNIQGMSSRRTESSFEDIITKESTYVKFMALRNILQEKPEKVMSLGPSVPRRTKIGRKRAALGNFVSRHPTLFDMYEDEEHVLWFGLSEKAEQLLEMERDIEKAYEAKAVEKVRKLLMMCVDKKLHVSKIVHLRRDFGLPEDFQKRFVYRYPQYFRVIPQPDGPVLELTSWDPSLAVTALERDAAHSCMDMPRFKICVAGGCKLKSKQIASLESFQKIPFVSPYTNPPDPTISKHEMVKRRVIILHELLSMTNEKRTCFDYLTHFRKEMMLPCSIMNLLLKFYLIFYVSRKGIRLTVFLKEAYNGMTSVEKNEWVHLKKRHLKLIAACRQWKRKTNKTEEAVK